MKGRSAVSLYALGVLAVLALYRYGGPNPKPSEPLRELEVTYIGCHEVMTGDRCLLTDTATLTFWLPEHRCPTAWRGRYLAEDARCEDTDDGMRVLVPMPKRRDEVTLRLDGATPWTMQVEPFDWPQVILDAKAAKAARDFDRTITIATTASTADDTMVRAAALGLLARGRHATGDDRWRETFEQSIATAEAAGWVSGEVDDRCAKSFRHRANLEFSAARTVVAESPGDAGAATYYRPYFGALVDLDTGSLGVAVRRLKTSIRWCRRLGIPPAGWLALRPLLETLSILGRKADGRRLLEELEAAAENVEDPCVKAELLNNAGWFGFQLREGHAREPSIARIKRAAILFGGACPDAANRFNALHSLAYGHLALGQVEKAAGTVSQLIATSETPARYRLQLDVLKGRISIWSGEFDLAQRILERVRQATSGEQWPGIHFEALISLAAIAERRGSLGAAVSYFTEAESVLAKVVRLAPLGEGLVSVAAVRSRGLEGLVRTLLAQGQPAQAMRVLRRHRRRGVGALSTSSRIGALAPDERRRWDNAVAAYRSARNELDVAVLNAWKAPGDREHRTSANVSILTARTRRLADEALKLVGAVETTEPFRVPDDSEAIALHYQGEHSDVWFVRTSTNRVIVLRLGGGDSIAARISDSLEPQIRRLRLLVAVGESPSADLVRALSRRFELELSLDLDGNSKRGSEGGRVLIVGDPRQDLPWALREARGAVKTYRDLGLDVELLTGAEARRVPLRTRLESGRFRLLHYAGHAEFDGPDGIESALWLAAGEEFGVSDVLTLMGTPQLVILSGCNTASTEGDAGLGISVAHAFLLAGADIVVGTLAPINDRGDGFVTAHLIRTVVDRKFGIQGALIDSREETARGDLVYWAYSR